MDEYSDILKKLYGLQNVGIKLGLERTFKLFENLGNPQKELKFIHIAGTNGKGSVCSTIAKALENAGFKVGFYSSPHLISLRERFRINGKGIMWDELNEIVKEIWPTVEKMINNKEYITFFEATVAIATIFFKRNKCDFVLWETGLGGRLDSTNIVDPIITGITGIGLDHEQYLGDTEEKIASEKAGIIKENVPVFVGKMNSGPYKVIKNTASRKNSPIFSVYRCNIEFNRKLQKEILMPGWEFKVEDNERLKNKKYFLPMPGEVQPNNLKLSYIILKYLSELFNFDLDRALQGIQKLKWPGRIQLLPDGKILDGAHNTQGIDEFITTVKSCYPDTKFNIIFGCLADRDPLKAIEPLREIADKFIFTPIDSIRPCFAPEKILKLYQEFNSEIQAVKAENSIDALNIAGSNKTVIIGSLYLAGEILKHYYHIDEIVNI